MVRRTISLSATLLLVMSGLLLATVLAIAVVSYIGYWSTVDKLSRTAGEQFARGAAAEVHGLLDPAEAVLTQMQREAGRGLLPIDETDRLADTLVERLRAERRFAWLSYGDEHGRFIGAYRHASGVVILNRSWIEPDGTGRMIEEVVAEDGSRTPFRKPETWDYDPRKRPWYRQAASSDHIVWTPPYVWYGNGGSGITASVPFRKDGALVGVFTIDFELTELTHFLHDLRLTFPKWEHGQIYIVDGERRIIGSAEGFTPGDTAAKDPVLVAALDALAKHSRAELQGPHAELVVHATGSYGTTFMPIDLPGGETWYAVSFVPINDVFGYVRTNLLWTTGIGLAAVVSAIFLARMIACRITRPLAEIVDDLEHAGQFEISDDKLPESRIREIQMIGRTTERMKTSLRSFGRYVPRELVRELISVGQEATLGAAPRTLSIFFSDVENFSKLCEVLRPDELVPLTSAYFTVVHDAIAKNHGTIDKFIGDGVLAFFNAPRDLPDHAAAACRAALAILATLEQKGMRHEAQREGIRVRTRIGLHTGEVLVGNIGMRDRFNYTAVGDGVNLAFGLQMLSKLYGTQIIASQDTHDGAGAGFEWRRLDRVAVKGRRGAGVVYELLGVTGETPAERLAIRDAYEPALELYLAQRFEEAAAAFEAIVTQFDDAASKEMLPRCRRMLAQPPGEDWQGIYIQPAEPVTE